MPTSSNKAIHPRTLICPELCVETRERTFSKVDLPAPFRPMIPTVDAVFSRSPAPWLHQGISSKSLFRTVPGSSIPRASPPRFEVGIFLPPNLMPPPIYIMRERPRPHLTETVELGDFFNTNDGVGHGTWSRVVEGRVAGLKK